MPGDPDFFGEGFRRRPRFFDRVRGAFPTTPYDDIPDGPAEAQRALIQERLNAFLQPLSSMADLSPATVVAVTDLVNSLAPAFMPVDDPSPYDRNLAVEGPGRRDIAGLLFRTLNDPTSETVVAVKYNTVNAGHYRSISATDREVTFDALLVCHTDAQGAVHHISRYIDWNFVMTQLGVVGSTRPVMGGTLARQAPYAPDDNVGGPPVIGPLRDPEGAVGPPAEDPTPTREPDDDVDSSWRRWVRSLLRRL